MNKESRSRRAINKMKNTINICRTIGSSDNKNYELYPSMWMEITGCISKALKITYEEAEEIVDQKVIAVIIFGSGQRHVSIKKNYLFFSRKYYTTCNDLDIAVIIDWNHKLLSERKSIKISEDVYMDVSGYQGDRLGDEKRHYLFLTKKDYLRGLKDKIEHNLAIQAGKVMYIDNIKTRDILKLK